MPSPDSTYCLVMFIISLVATVGKPSPPLGGSPPYSWRARLYVAKWYKPEEGEVSYRPTKIEVSAGNARKLALPGKLLHRRRERRAQQTAAQRVKSDYVD